MAVTPVSSSASDTGRTRLIESYDTFMKLLTAQIQNQDPLKPMDSTQFTQQLVQMTGVEQQLLTNDLLEKLIQNTSSGIQTAVSLLGREVRAVHDTAKLQNGKAEWSYKLGANASDVTLEVLDEYGRVVRTVKPTENGAGDHTFTWDGKDLLGAQRQNGGTYTLRVTAKDSTGAAVSATPFVKGLVTGVEQTDGKTLITVNGVQIGWEKVTSISDVKAAENEPPANDDEDEPSSQQSA
ncbi:MAG: flagellar hook assembly protein FlgD [Phenylobacterium sp.]|jgi:flagellar basal-body rod modification protein FlgD|uniref:flagellar hook assembly protein FlgD n=1 Tax=Phenylobacterium sp. TaxID=1871053 RepID=UPI00391D8DE1